MKEGEDAIGEIKINNEVIAVMAGRIATEVKGVAGMSGGVVDGLAKMLGKKSLEKGVKVEVGEEDINIDLSIIVDYGVSIPDVCSEIQINVKRKVEKMTGRNVRNVNLSVQGIHFPADQKEIEEKEKKETEEKEK